MTHLRIKSVVTNYIVKSEGTAQTYIGLEHVASGTGQLATDDLPVTEAHDSVCHKAGDVLFGKLRPYLSKSFLASTAGTATGELLVLRPGEQIDGRFLRYLTLSDGWISWANATSYGSKMPRTSWESMADYMVWLPTLKEQQKIADYLDVEMMKLDRLTVLRRRQCKALEEHELALVSEVLSGSDLRARKPTGWTWMPTIPAEWQIGPVYAYFSTELGKMLNPDRATGRNQQPYLRNANVHWYEIDTDDISTMSFENEELQRYSVSPGDLLVCEGGAGVAEAAVWDGRIQECYFQKSLHRVRSAGPLPVEWLMYWLRLAKHVGLFESEGNLSTIPHLTGEQLRRYRIPIPIDGRMRVARLRKGVAQLTDARRRLEQAQRLLSERRQALITAAVTGQFDVSTAQGVTVS